jgi:hypothetical protein
MLNVEAMNKAIENHNVKFLEFTRRYTFIKIIEPNGYFISHYQPVRFLEVI